VSLPSPSRARFVDAVIAVVGIACGGFALWMRHAGWAIEWPLSWVVALSAIVPAGAGVACAVFAARSRLARRPASPEGSILVWLR